MLPPDSRDFINDSRDFTESAPLLHGWCSGSAGVSRTGGRVERRIAAAGDRSLLLVVGCRGRGQPAGAGCLEHVGVGRQAIGAGYLLQILVVALHGERVSDHVPLPLASDWLFVFPSGLV